jgi:predicted nucleic acid-binding protein
LILADTSVWIEFLKGKEPIFSRFEDFLKLGRIFSVPWIFGELLQGARDDEDARRIEAFWRELPKLEDNELSDTWIKAGLRSGREQFISKGVGLIDAAIIEAAVSRGGVVWTLDKKLQKLTPVGHRF